MQNKTSMLRQYLTGFALAALCTLIPGGASLAQQNGKDGDRQQWEQQRQQQRQEWVRAKLDKDEARLEIKASQQGAWDEYANARKALAEHAPGKLPKDADAATITKHHAERATEMARKLTTLAAATAKLQAVLSPDQRKILDHIARHHHHHGHHGWGMRHHHGMERGGDRADGGEWNHGPRDGGSGSWGPKPGSDAAPAAK